MARRQGSAPPGSPAGPTPHTLHGERSVWFPTAPAGPRRVNHDDGPQAPRSGALDLHEGISHPGPQGPEEGPSRGCQRWPERMRLRSSNGELVRGRCRSTNLCAYCAKLGAVENSELLALDALAGRAPELWAVLTTRSTARDPAAFYRSRELVMRALRRRWPDCEYAALVEFTTGYGPRAGGHRRPHWNLLLKGIPATQLDAARAVICDVWCEREDAEPQGQYVGEIADAGGVMAYVALHFQKESQAPPAGWRGHRFLKSRGYLSTSTPEAREAARRSLRFKRELWRQLRRGESALDAELTAHRAMAIADDTTWQLVQVPAGVDELPLMVARSGPCARCAALDGPCAIHAPVVDERELADVAGVPALHVGHPSDLQRQDFALQAPVARPAVGGLDVPVLAGHEKSSSG